MRFWSGLQCCSPDQGFEVWGSDAGGSGYTIGVEILLIVLQFLLINSDAAFDQFGSDDVGLSLVYRIDCE